MRLFFYILIGCFAMSCSDVSEIENEEVKDKPEVDQNKQNYWSENSCLRGIPTSTLYAKKLKKHTFKLEKDRGVETAIWKNGDSLLISNKGCEIFLLTYTFYVKGIKLQEDHAELIKYCFKRVEEIDLAPIDFQGGINTISKLQENGKPIKLGYEYLLKEDNVSEMFEIDEIDLKQNASKIVFSYAIGTL